MIHCKKYIIATCFSLVLPIGITWAAAPVVDDSDRFAMLDEQAYDAPASYQSSKYDDGFSDDEAPLAKEDASAPAYKEPSGEFKANANAIDKIQALQQEIQELRGQIEVQAHDLKLLQQQQLAFYKDLDARLGASSGKIAQTKPSTPLTIAPAVKPQLPVAKTKTAPVPVVPKIEPVVSRGNPADEQISYLASYELLKNKKFDEAIVGMQTFVQKYPRGGYTANAQYWLGELYLQKKAYSEAVVHFEVVLNQFPSSSKAADSMLKLGYAQAASGNVEEAQKSLQNVLTTYPNTHLSQLAQLKLESLKAL